jgi:hypothetical protein
MNEKIEYIAHDNKDVEIAAREADLYVNLTMEVATQQSTGRWDPQSLVVQTTSPHKLSHSLVSAGIIASFSRANQSSPRPFPNSSGMHSARPLGG